MTLEGENLYYFLLSPVSFHGIAGVMVYHLVKSSLTGRLVIPDV